MYAGGHIRNNQRRGYGGFVEARPRVVLAVDEGGALLEAKEKSGGHTITIFRTTEVYTEAPEGFNSEQDMAALARRWYPLLKAKWRQNPADYYTITNEIGGGDGATLPRLVEYEREMMRLANADGFLVCVLNQGSGSPHPIEIWKRIAAPFILEAWERGNLYGRHVYGNGDLLATDDEDRPFRALVDRDGSLSGNARRPFEEMAYLKARGGRGGLAITECGFSGGHGYIGDELFVEQAVAYGQALRAEPDILGPCWWELGDTEFEANWQTAIPLLIPVMRAHPAPKWKRPKPAPKPDPDPDPTPKPDPHPQPDPQPKRRPRRIKHTLHLIPQNTTPDELKRLAAHLHPMRSAFSYSHDVAEAVMFHSTKEGKIVAWEPGRWDMDLRQQFAWLNVGYEERSFSEIGATSPPSHLDVKPLSQRDRRWAAEILGQNTGHNRTIGSWGCLLTAYTVWLNFMKVDDRLPADINRRLTLNGAFNSQYILPAALRTAYPDAVAYDGYLTGGDAMHTKIRSWLEQGIPVPARVDMRPLTAVNDQHWVLLIGVAGDDYVMADPWTGIVAFVGPAYDQVLEALFYRLKPAAPPPPPPARQTIDVLPYLRGDGRIYEVRHPGRDGKPGPQETFQVQREGNQFWLVKNSQWEEFAFDDEYIWRGLDTSPGPAPREAERPGQPRYYRQFERDRQLARWVKRHMAVGETFVGPGHVVLFYYKADCAASAIFSGKATNRVTLVAHHERLVWHGVVVHDIIELTDSKEHFWFARDFGLVAWSSGWGQSAICEIHVAGSRPSLQRERIGCLK